MRKFVVIVTIATGIRIASVASASADSNLHFYGPDADQSCTAELHQLDPTGTTTGDWCGMDPAAAPGQGEILYIRPSIKRPGDASPLSVQGFAQRLGRILGSGSASASE